MLTFPTPNPSALLAKIEQAIIDKHVETWSFDSIGDFTHTPNQFRLRAWLRPEIGVGELRFTIVPSTNFRLTWALYAIYQGRFVEMMISHFHDDISGPCKATPMLEGNDILP